jgi:dGTPase
MSIRGLCVAIKAEREKAPFAADPTRSRGRLFREEPSPTRNDFRRDCDRIIHSTAFRRLKHKTQVFVAHEGDHYRTRLTHTLEVAQIARALARSLGLDEDLTETLALAHDLGHPPFGHAGERALDECMRSFGGFDHNAQALRIVTNLERRYATFDGLNLTWESLEGIVKHNGPLTDRSEKAIGRYKERGVPSAIADYVKVQDLDLWSFASGEAQAAAVADDIAYDAHDLDDALRANLFSIEEIAGLPAVSGIYRKVKAQYKDLEGGRLTNEVTRRLIAQMIEDVIAESDRRIANKKISSIDNIRNSDTAVVSFSQKMTEADRDIKKFLTPRMYQHERVLATMDKAQGVLRNLFSHYFEQTEDLPQEWKHGLQALDESGKARRIADFIAGMTDNFALAEHRRFFNSASDLR